MCCWSRSSRSVGLIALPRTAVAWCDPALTAVGRFPAIDLVASGVVRPELLVGDAGAEAIAKARAESLA